MSADMWEGFGSETEPARHSWSPVDLTAIVAGTWQTPEPTVGARGDGAGMFYPGRQHTVVSESEGGKTFLFLLQARTELDRGHSVVYVDFEDEAAAIVGRLLALGTDRAAVRDRFAYIRPEDPIGSLAARTDLAQALADLHPSLAVLDGVTEAMTLHGLDPLSNKDAATFGRLLPRWITSHGPAVVSGDHVVKDRDGRGRYALGAVHKLNALDGAAFVLENRTPFGVGITGRSTVLLAKDRPGQLRHHALPTSGHLHWWADLTITSHDPTYIDATLDPPTARPDTFRPTVLMARISDALTRAPEPLSVRGVLDRVKSKRQEDVRAALAALVDDGYITVEPGPRGAHLHRLTRPFTEDDQ